MSRAVSSKSAKSASPDRRKLILYVTLGVIVVLYMHHYRSPAARLISSHMRDKASPRPRRGATKR